jgi:hypothetical protein
MSIPKEEIEEHIRFLLDNPDKTLGSIYHDAGTTWELVEVLLEKIRDYEDRALDQKYYD